MRIQRASRIHPGFLYLAPLVNSVLILLFFFMLSSSFLLQPGIEVRVPPSPFLLAPRGTLQVVSLTGAPHPAVYFQDEEVSTAELRTMLAEATQQGRTLVIKADETTPYAQVAAVMNIALDLGYSTVLAGHAER